MLNIRKLTYALDIMEYKMNFYLYNERCIMCVY